MFVTNKTAAVINYGNKAYGPNATFEMSDADASRRGEKAMIKSGLLQVSLKAPEPGTGKPSDGLKLDEIKAALTERGVSFDSSANKAELAKLLDEAP